MAFGGFFIRLVCHILLNFHIILIFYSLTVMIVGSFFSKVIKLPAY